MDITNNTDPIVSGTVVLAVGAHADDIDFCASGTVARLTAQGATVYYLVLTDGSKGSADPMIDQKALVLIRQQEQRQAAAGLGVEDVIFMDYEDGELVVSHQLKKDIVRVIRQLQPDTVISWDPTMAYYAERNFINHPDHLAAGQAVMDAVYPLARDCFAFPELAGDDCQPHKVKTMLLINFSQPNYYVDIGSTIDQKLAALRAHDSQMPDMAKVEQKVRSYAQSDGQAAGVELAEAFVKLTID